MERKTLLVIGDNPYELAKKYGPDNYSGEPYVKYRYADRGRIYRNMVKAAEVMGMDEESLGKLRGMGADVYFSNLGVGYDCDDEGNITTFENPDMKYDFLWECDGKGPHITRKDGAAGCDTCLVSEIMFSTDGSRIRELISNGAIDAKYRAMFRSDDEMVAYNTSVFSTNAVLGDEGWSEFDPTVQNDVDWVVKYEETVMRQCSGDDGKKATLMFFQ